MAAKTRPEGLPYADYVLPVTYATFSALFGTIAVVMAKVLSELVTLWITGTDIFFGGDAWFTWATLVAWIAFVAVWLFRMNEALSLYDPLFIIPLLQVNFILFAIISGEFLKQIYGIQTSNMFHSSTCSMYDSSGGIFFKEFDYFRTINVIGFCCGVAMLLGGIFLLSPEMAAPPKVAPAPPSPSKMGASNGSDNNNNSSSTNGNGASPPLQAQPDSSSSSSSSRGLGQDEEAGRLPPGQGRGGFTMRGSARVAPVDASIDDANEALPPGTAQVEAPLSVQSFGSREETREIYRL